MAERKNKKQQKHTGRPMPKDSRHPPGRTAQTRPVLPSGDYARTVPPAENTPAGASAQRKPAQRAPRPGQKKSARKRSIPDAREGKRRSPAQARRARRESSGLPSRRTDILYRVLLLGAVAAALFVMATVFFKVTVIDVVGNSKANAEKLREASGIKTGDKLLFIDGQAVKQAVMDSEPYVDDMKLLRRPPNRVILEITESVPVAYVEQSGMAYVIDRNAKLLEMMPVSDAPALPAITGLRVSAAPAGDTIALEDELYVESLRQVLEGVLLAERTFSVDSIKMERLYDVSFVSQGRFTVRIGDTADIGQKITLLEEVIARLEPTDRGTITIEDAQEARFRPEYASATS